MADSIELQKPVFSGWPMIIGWLAMLIFALHASTHMVAAGDTWVALACGRHFWNHGVDTVEPFSANSHHSGPTEETMAKYAGELRAVLADKNNPPTGIKASLMRWWLGKVENYPNWSPRSKKLAAKWHPTGWVNQNWLTHEIFYWLACKSPIADAATNTFNSLVYWKFSIYILAVICVYCTSRILGVNPALSAVFACFAMFTGRPFIDIRPAGFSNLLVAVFLLIFVLTTYHNILYIWLIVPLAVFWCNVHGGYIYLFIMLIPFIGVNLLTCLSKKWFATIGPRGLVHTVVVGIVTFIAVVIFNPFHLTNLTHTFVISVSKHAEMWRQVNEWHPAFEWDNPVGTSFPFFVLFVVFIGLVLLWLFSRLMKPRLLTAPKNELDVQGKFFDVVSEIFGYAATIFICWVVFIGFSFLSPDPASFIICAIFAVVLLLSIYKSIHFIYVVIPLTLIALWTSNAAAGYSGRYIYPFVLIPVFVSMHIIASLVSENVKYRISDIGFVFLAGTITLSLMVAIFNPFKFNAPLWDVSQFLHLQRIWYPFYELTSNARLDYTFLFPVLYVINAASIAIWLILPFIQRFFALLPDKVEQRLPPVLYQLPKIDLAQITIAVLTVYMAMRSRRFIPIAAIVSCPVIAMLATQIVRTVSAAFNFHRKRLFAVPPMTYRLQASFIFSGILTVLLFGTWWGWQFKNVYLDPWPRNQKLNSVFIRMTNSDAKPFYACEFIRDNKLSGKMFNYWTEGGFIAWGQEPDPNTGRTPLQLFIDGRAQAAYEPAFYLLWQNIMNGGPYALGARTRKEEADIAKIGRWIDEQMRRYSVWIILMPNDQWHAPFVKAIERHPDWQMVFSDDEQRLFVNIRTPRGRELLDGIFDGRTVCRNEFSKNLVLADILLRNEKTAEKGFNFALKAFQSNPSRASVTALLAAVRFPALKEKVYNCYRDYSEDFEKNKNLYAEENGYSHRLVAAWFAAIYLQDVAQTQHNITLAQYYQGKKTQYGDEISNLYEKIFW